MTRLLDALHVLPIEPDPTPTPGALDDAHALWNAAQHAQAALSILVADGYVLAEAGEQLPTAWHDRFHAATQRLQDQLTLARLLPS